MFRVRLFRMRGRDLQTVEKDAGAFGIKLVGSEGLQNIGEGELKGRAVLDGRKGERWVMRGFALREQGRGSKEVRTGRRIGRCCCQAWICWRRVGTGWLARPCVHGVIVRGPEAA